MAMVRIRGSKVTPGPGKEQAWCPWCSVMRGCDLGVAVAENNSNLGLQLT